jgi:formylglycine-generating enzyme required for sulfatase activity
MEDKEFKDQLAGLLSGLDETTEALEQPRTDLAEFGQTVADAGDELETLFSDDLTATDEPGPDVPAVKPNPDPATVLHWLQTYDSDQVIDEQLLQLLKSRRPGDRRRAVQSLARAHGEWALGLLLQAAADDDPEVGGLALEALLGLGDRVKDHVLDLAQFPDAPQHLGCEAYLSALLHLPLVYVSPGPFIMGSDVLVNPLAEPNERPQHELALPGYWIGRRPVTPADLQTFVAESDDAPDVTGRQAAVADHPLVDVSWHEAATYCRWLTAVHGLPIALPSEAEWEKAARGSDGRRYPWGEQTPTSFLCNFGNQVGRTTPVEQFSPQGDSPFGCTDMAGNVWEWTRSVFSPYPTGADVADNIERVADQEESESGEVRVLRGGAFNTGIRALGCTVRTWDYPDHRSGDVGFRVVISARS